MKKLALLIGLVPFAANADVTIYYSPTCPHCHNALNFFDTEKIEINRVNVMEPENMAVFRAALAECEYTDGGVPVIVIDGKCWQGYAEFMNDELRTAASGSTATADSAPKKNSTIWFYGALIAFAAVLGVVFTRRKKK